MFFKTESQGPSPLSVWPEAHGAQTTKRSAGEGIGVENRGCLLNSWSSGCMGYLPSNPQRKAGLIAFVECRSVVAYKE